MLLRPEVKEKWTKALRSNNYKQGYDCLETLEGANCCLGVLIKVAFEDVKRKRQNDGSVFLTVPSLVETVENDLSYRMKQRMTYKNNDYFKGIETPFGDADFIILNDDSKMSFDTIATLIEIWC